MKSWIENAECGWWLPEGWQELVQDLCKRMLAHLKEGGLDESAIHIAQVKEKFGGLRFYWEPELDSEGHPVIDYDSSLYKVLHCLVQDAEMTSLTTCQCCGNPAQQVSTGYWVSTKCEECRKENEKALEEFHSDD